MVKRISGSAARALLLMAACIAMVGAVLHFDQSHSVTASGSNSISVVDSVGNVGADSSLVLDSTGNPVISSSDFSNGTFLVAHCNDTNCVGGDESIMAPDGSGTAILPGSIALDSLGNPVVPYFDSSTYDLKLLHCNDPLCAGGDESLAAVVPFGLGRGGAAVVIGATGNPFISFSYNANYYLGTVSCNDPDCGGGDESVVEQSFCCVNSTSATLDAGGNPVVAYGDLIGHGDLKLLHCADPDCGPATPSNAVPDALGNAGIYVSLVLDALGNPVMSYYDYTDGDLRVMHCDDPNCAGKNESVSSPDRAGDVGFTTSLALDSLGNPVISYYDGSNGDLKVMHCNDPECVGGDESIAVPDSLGDVGSWTSLALDSFGYPVVSYYDYTNGDLKLLHCGDPLCKGVPVTPTPTSCPSCRPNFSVGIDTNNDGTDDCATRGGPGKCFEYPGAQFKLKIYLDSVPAELSPFERIDLRGTWSGVSFPKNLNWTYGGCGGWFTSPADFGSSCYSFDGKPFTLSGLIVTVDFQCLESGGTGQVALIHGVDLTDVVSTEGASHPESDKGVEALTVSCSALPTPTAPGTSTSNPTPTATRTPTPTRTSTPTPTLCLDNCITPVGTPASVGAVSLDPASGGSARPRLGLLAEVIGLTAVALGGAALYIRRRRHL